MLKKFSTLVFIILFFLAGCASPPQMTVVDNVGRVTPNPSYSLSDTQQTIFVSFWITAYVEMQDINEAVLVPKFMEINKSYDIDLSKYKRITLTMEVHNPNQIQYDLYKRVLYKKGKNTAQEGGPLAVSKLRHRSYKVDLPLNDKMKDCNFSIILHGEVDQKMILIHVGDIQYSTRGGGGE